MKHLFLIVLLFASSSFAFGPDEYTGSTFDEVWSAIQAQPKEAIPTKRVSRITEFFDRDLLAEAKRTHEESFDLFAMGTKYPPRRKLAHPSGICYSGTWTIDTDSAFTGLFTKGTNVPIIVRGSEAMGYVDRGNTRALGFAGKLFPGVDPADSDALKNTKVKTANFFTIDDLGGTDIETFFESTFFNEPEVTINPVYLSPNVAFVGGYIASTFRAFDKEHAGIRQVYPISEAGLEDVSKAVTPLHMRIVGGNFQRIKPIDDFRLESQLSNYELQPVFQIEVRATAKDEWQDIGEIKLEADVISLACDQALHFKHPKWKD